MGTYPKEHRIYYDGSGFKASVNPDKAVASVTVFGKNSVLSLYTNNIFVLCLFPSKTLRVRYLGNESLERPLTTRR